MSFYCLKVGFSVLGKSITFRIIVVISFVYLVWSFSGLACKGKFEGDLLFFIRREEIDLFLGRKVELDFIVDELYEILRR